MAYVGHFFFTDLRSCQSIISVLTLDSGHERTHTNIRFASRETPKFLRVSCCHHYGQQHHISDEDYAPRPSW